MSERGQRATSLLDFDAPLDPVGVAQLLAWGHPLGERSLLKDVRWEACAPVLLPPDPHPASLTFPRRADRLWDLLVQASDRQGAWASLSGGLDSRAVAAASLTHEPRQLATFGDADSVDLPVARRVAQLLGAPHRVSVLPLDAALRSEERVFVATGGLGGPSTAPGAHTDEEWRAPELLSGTSGDVVWGDTALPGPTSASRLRKLGLAAADPSARRRSAPQPPPWASMEGRSAWVNLCTRQARVTWSGALSRFPGTEVVPVPWDPQVLSFCLALDGADRADRALLRATLDRHAPTVGATVVPPVRGPVHDLDRAMRSSPAWRDALNAMIAEPARWAELGLRPRGVLRLLRLVRDGKRARSELVSRLRVLWRWSQRTTP